MQRWVVDVENLKTALQSLRANYESRHSNADNDKIHNISFLTELMIYTQIPVIVQQKRILNSTVTWW
jgi:hypothetical protein